MTDPGTVTYRREFPTDAGEPHTRLLTVVIAPGDTVLVDLAAVADSLREEGYTQQRRWWGRRLPLWTRPADPLMVQVGGQVIGEVPARDVVAIPQGTRVTGRVHRLDWVDVDGLLVALGWEPVTDPWSES